MSEPFRRLVPVSMNAVHVQGKTSIYSVPACSWRTDTPFHNPCQEGPLPRFRFGSISLCAVLGAIRSEQNQGAGRYTSTTNHGTVDAIDTSMPGFAAGKLTRMRDWIVSMHCGNCR